jgi:hypothetical protein
MVGPFQHHLVALGDHIHDLHAVIGEGSDVALVPPAHFLSEGGRHQVVEDVRGLVVYSYCPHPFIERQYGRRVTRRWMNKSG